MVRPKQEVQEVHQMFDLLPGFLLFGLQPGNAIQAIVLLCLCHDMVGLTK
eukprot:CAMPEP_0172687538 /NCGR_PEP_ID=MMETSP1074-20121228/21757_1 /TAXON_ID=2916 /ORGANISM="Ceratium fusus, Strain PA161109" /LENGTH=49 /DNA_ID=CAMNT_0013507007 /DNA_START=92 /DNA_END=241 /DNA_ORIENTATION=+